MDASWVALNVNMSTVGVAQPSPTSNRRITAAVADRWVPEVQLAKHGFKIVEATTWKDRALVDKINPANDMINLEALYEHGLKQQDEKVKDSLCAGTKPYAVLLIISCGVAQHVCNGPVELPIKEIYERALTDTDNTTKIALWPPGKADRQVSVRGARHLGEVFIAFFEQKTWDLLEFPPNGTTKASDCPKDFIPTPDGGLTSINLKREEAEEKEAEGEEAEEEAEEKEAEGEEAEEEAEEKEAEGGGFARAPPVRKEEWGAAADLYNGIVSLETLKSAREVLGGSPGSFDEKPLAESERCLPREGILVEEKSLRVSRGEAANLHARTHLSERRSPRRDSGVDLVFPEACEVPGGATVALDLGVRAFHLSPEPRAFWLGPQQPREDPPHARERCGAGRPRLPRPHQSHGVEQGPSSVPSGKGPGLFQLVSEFEDLSPSEFEVLSPSDPRASLHFSESESLRGGGGFGSTGSSGSAAPAANLHARTHLSERRSPTGIVESNRKDERLLAAFVRIQSRGAAAGLRAWCLYAWHSHTRHKKAVCWLNSRLTSRFKSWCLWCLYAWRAQVVT
jgi:hypothetical protein